MSLAKDKAHPLLSIGIHNLNKNTPELAYNRFQWLQRGPQSLMSVEINVDAGVVKYKYKMNSQSFSHSLNKVGI